MPWLISLVVVIWVNFEDDSQQAGSGLDIDGFSRLPVLVGGRIMPMETLGTHVASMMNHHGTFAVDGKVEPASRWLLDVFMYARVAWWTARS